MYIPRLLVSIPLAMTICLALDAVADDEIYRWVDEDGVVHFGDQPNAAGDSEAIEIKNNPTRGSQAPSPAKAAVPDNSMEQKVSIAEQRRVERAERRKLASEKREAITAGCEQRRQIVARLEPSPRVMIENDDGTIERLDDDKRLEMLDEAKTYIRNNCSN